MSDGRLVALLRGVNVGGKNRVPMRDLCAVFAEAGCVENESYIQSGNVVFRSECSVDALQEKLALAIEASFGFAVPVVVRTAEGLTAALEANPFREIDESRLSVMFLRDPPSAAGLAKLEGDRFLPERFAVVGGEIYLDMPNGAGRSKMTTAYFDARLKTVGTVRNLRTVRALAAMAKG